MSKLGAVVLAAAFCALPAGATAADSMSSAMAMPKCASGDPMIGVNMNTKMYMTTDQMKAKSAGMSSAQKQAMMQKNHVKLMCKSTAVAAGMKPMPSAMSSSTKGSM
jgi:hypothetical protein